MVMIIVIVVPFLKYEGVDYSTYAWLKNLKVVAKDTSYSNTELENMASDAEISGAPGLNPRVPSVNEMVDLYGKAWRAF